MNRAARRTLDGALALAVAVLSILIVRAAASSTSRLTRDPLDLPALRDVALGLDRGGQLDRADAILAFVSRRSWRDWPTEVWLLRRRLDQGRYREAFERADSLLRQDADKTTRPILFNLLIAAADEPQARSAVVARLRAGPSWRGDFLQALGTDGAIAGAWAVFSALTGGPTPPTPDEYAPFIDRLASSGDYEGAHTAWLQIARPRDAAPMSLRDGDFTGGSDHTPFTWSTASGVGATSETGGAADLQAPALRVDYDGYSAPSLPAQLLVLAPGRYLVSWRERLDPPIPKKMTWRLRCADTNRIVAQAAAPVPGWRDAAMSFEAPASGCAAQWLELAPLGGERRTTITGWYAGFRVQRLP